MSQFDDLICPVSRDMVDENQVRTTALFVVLLSGAFLITGNSLFPLILVVDFFIRAFTPLKYSPLSWLARQMIRVLRIPGVMINKGPKVFAARVGLIFAALMFIFSLLSFSLAGLLSASVLVFFAFMECALNFCTGCWVYGRIVYPLIRK